MKVKVLLIEADDTYGSGLAGIRKRENELIDISAFDLALSDSTSTTCPAFLIKDNKVYRLIRNYLDLDKNERIFLAKIDMEPNDIIPEDTPVEDTEEETEEEN